jgi:hypothetical protein
MADSDTVQAVWLSAENSMSNNPRSAVRAISTKCGKFTPASAWHCGRRHAAM